jgi:DNA polymerase III gamma/tau subunit
VLSYASPGGAGPESNAEVDERLLEEILGTTQRKILYEFAQAVIQENAGRCVELVAQAATQGADIPRLSRDLVEHFRNLLVVSLMREREKEKGTPQPLASSRLLDLPEDEIGDLERQASALSKETIMDYFSLMAAADEALARSTYPRFALETVLVRLATLPKALPVSVLLERLEALEGRLGGQEATPANTGLRETKADFVAEETTPPSPGQAFARVEDKTETWKRFVSFVTKEKRFLGSYLEKVRALELSSTQLRLGVEDRHCLGYLRDSDNINFLKDFARRFFSSEVAVTVTPWGAPDGGIEGSMNSVQAQDALSTMTDATLRTFGGRVKEIKKNL